ncbi:DUF5719 family protein [Euzebya pacifica]|uniref:DUF5719 family protein n=1 Tax=Euzebya pacifica TaxID=1608957 RepID=UPI0030F91E45
MSDLDRPRGRKRGVALLLASILVVVGSVAASQATTSRELAAPSPAAVDVATTGTAYCPITAEEGGGAALVLSSASDIDSEVAITRYVDGAPVVEPPSLLQAGTSATLPIPAAQLGQPLTVSWRGGPMVASYQLTDGEEVAVSGCATSPASQWHLTGFDTSLGSESLLHLMNPFDQDALVSLQFGTAEGRVELVIADELLVPAGSSEVLDLAQFRPEAPDLAVTVTSRAGRVVPQGQVRLAPPAENVEGPTGTALIEAVSRADEDIAVAEATSDDVTTSWLTVYNPGTRAAAVQLQVSTPLGDAASLASETTVPAGGTTRIDLQGLSALPRFGVRLTSVNGVGVVATRTSAIEDVQRTGVAVASAVPAAAVGWTVSGGQAASSTVTLYNPGAEVATANVQVAGGMPETWTAVAVPPNGVTSLSLSEATPEGPARVSTDLPLVAGVVNLRPESATAFWSATGVDTGALLGGGQAVAAQRDPGLTSIPAISATATPTPEVVDETGGAEGGVGSEAEDVGPSVTPVPLPEITPPVIPSSTASPAASGASEAEDAAPTPSTTAPAPAPSGEPSASPTPLPPGTSEEEGSLFGKVRRGHRRRPTGR